MDKISIQTHLDLINALFESDKGWRETQARKSHVDEFGQRISAGDIYYSRNKGNGFGSCLRLSAKAMEIFLGLLFTNAPVLCKVCEKEHARRKDQVESLIMALDYGE